MNGTETKSGMTWGDPEKAFSKAIESGRLSRDEKSDNYAAHFMYMGNYKDKDLFKNSLTRDYIE